MSLRRPTLLAVVALVAIVATPAPAPVATTSTSFVSSFSIVVPVSAAAHGDLGNGAVNEDTGIPLSITGSATFPDVEPGGDTVSTTLTLTNDGAAPLSLTATATALTGPEGAVIPSSHLGFSIDGAAGALTGAADLGVLASGESAQLVLTLTPPNSDVSYLPSGEYAGTLSIIGEVAD